MTHNDGSDCCQGEHYEPESTMNDAFTRLSEAGFDEDWGSAEDQVYDHTTAEERGEWMISSRGQPVEELNALVFRLIRQVDDLEAEVKRLRDERQRWLNHRCVFQ